MEPGDSWVAGNLSTVSHSQRRGSVRPRRHLGLSGAMDGQMVFAGTTSCPTFSPNPFKADMCVACQVGPPPARCRIVCRRGSRRTVGPQ